MPKSSLPTLVGMKASVFADNVAMDTDKIKIFGARVRVDGTSKLAELERAEKVGPLCEAPAYRGRRR